MAPDPRTKVVTGEVRLSYVHLLEPFTSDPKNQDPKYSCAIIIPKSDTKTIKAIKEAQKAALEAGLESKWGGKRPKKFTLTLHDGDNEDETDLERNPEYANSYYMNVSSKTKPGIVDGQLRPVDSADQVYSGVYARVSIRAFPYSNKGNNGISFGLNNVQIIRDGEAFGAVSSPSDDFEALDPVDFDDDDDDLI